MFNRDPEWTTKEEADMFKGCGNRKGWYRDDLMTAR